MPESSLSEECELDALASFFEMSLVFIFHFLHLD